MSLSAKIVDSIDGLNERIGRWTAWLIPAVVALGAWNAVARYVSRYTDANLSSNAYLEMQWYMFSMIFLLGGAYTLKREEHVRVDVFHASLHASRQAWIDVAGTVLFLIPFSLFMIWSSWIPFRNSWAIGETSPDPGGLPRYPVKFLVPLAFFLLLLQGIALLIRRIRFIQGSRPSGRASVSGGQPDRDTHEANSGSGP